MRGRHPIRADPDRNIQRNRHLHRTCHLPTHNLFNPLCFTLSDLHKKLIVDLNQEPGLQLRFRQSLSHIHHRDLDNVRGTALD